jgi:hypothetical protein
MTKIRLKMAGQPMEMSSCSNCEARWWDDQDGRRVQLDGVLALATKDGRRRR